MRTTRAQKKLTHTLPHLPDWPLWMPLLAVAIFIVNFLLLQRFFPACARTLGATGPVECLIHKTFQWAVPIGLICAIAVRRFGSISAAQVGITRPRTLPTICWTIVALLLMLLGAVLIPTGQPDENVMSGRPDEALLIIEGTITAVAAGVFEELYFRGLLFGPLVRKIGIPLAAVSTGLFFGILHTGIVGGCASTSGGLTIAWVGILFALLYWRTGSLLPGIAAHVAVDVWAMTFEDPLPRIAAVIVCVTVVMFVLLRLRRVQIGLTPLPLNRDTPQREPASEICLDG